MCQQAAIAIRSRWDVENAVLCAALRCGRAHALLLSTSPTLFTSVPRAACAQPRCLCRFWPARSGASGFLLPLSGGADSSSVAAIVGCMCQMACAAVDGGDDEVLADVVRRARRANRETSGHVRCGAGHTVQALCPKEWWRARRSC